jgi:hypothetical protein
MSNEKLANSALYSVVYCKFNSIQDTSSYVALYKLFNISISDIGHFENLSLKSISIEPAQAD